MPCYSIFVQEIGQLRQLQIIAARLRQGKKPHSRDGADRIEQIGIEKSRQSIEKADLVLLVLDRSQPLDEQDKELLRLTENKKRILLLNKDDLPSQIDLSDPQFANAISISALNKEVDALSSHLAELFETPSFQWTDRKSVV